MTAALDVEFEQIMSSGDAPEPQHALCARCYLADALPVEVTTCCGRHMTSAAWLANRSPGKPKCATCLSAPLPCGH